MSIDTLNQQAAQAAQQPDTTQNNSAALGSLLVVGGSERLDKQTRILRRFVDMTNRVPGRRPIIILTSATGHPEILGGEYVRIFHELGWPAGELFMPAVSTRDQASRRETVEQFRNAAGIYITGGDQVALMDIIAGTPSEAAIREAYMNGAIIGGTSAGASAIGNPMIARGGSGDLKRGMITLRDGLGLIGHDIIVDTHFGQRGRFPRLVAAAAERPQDLAIGIDENTGMILSPSSRTVEVVGAGVIYFLDASKSAPSDAPLGTSISMTPLSLHVLGAGRRYNLDTRQPE